MFRKLALLGATLLALLAAATPAAAYSLITDALTDIEGTRRATYRVVATGYGAYATPTDMICLSGSATKSVAVSAFALTAQATAASKFDVYWIKRSAANTGGTSTTPTPVSINSTNAAATAVVRVWTVIPAGLGTSAGTVGILLGLATASTAGNAAVNTPNGAFGFTSSLRSGIGGPIVLHGVAESLCANFNGAAIPSGLAITYNIEWIEYVE
jgi:hypothetical protein